MIKIAVVILNWNGKSYLEKFLPSVIQYSQPARIIVADNGSTDDSVPFLKKNFPSVKILESAENSGFAGGYNKALSKIYDSASEEERQELYYILLNSDVEVTENWIGPVIRLMEKDKSVAAAQPKIRSWHDKEKFEYAGAAGGFIDKLGYPFCRGRIFNTVETDMGQYDDEKEIFWATGACLFVKAELFHKAEGFDAGFFAHMEEIDLCWRLKNSGYKIYYCPGSVVYHIGGGTLHKSNPKKTFLNFRNNLWLLLKNLPAGRIFPVFILRLLLDGVAGLKFLSEGNAGDFFAVIKAHFSVYFHFASILRKRGKTQKKYLSAMYRRSIVLDYFIRGKKVFTSLENLVHS